MLMPRRAALALLLLLPAACSTVSVDSNTAMLERAAPGATAGFNQALAQEYLAFTRSERGWFDWIDADYFARKGQMAARGDQPPPENPDNRYWWGIKPASLGPLREGRTRLVAALDRNGRTAAPQAAAQAQASYDCWVEQEQEGWQVDEIARCRRAFETAVAQVEAASAPGPAQAQPAPAAAPAPAPAAPQAFIVFFAWDRADINPIAAQVLNRAAEEFRRTGSTRVRIEGHTDTSGAAAYNQRLSERRAQAVVGYLASQGVPVDAMRSAGFGESRPRVRTDDNVRNDENRRAEIAFER